jgi:hypothetical protein
MANTVLERVEIRDNPQLEELSLEPFAHLQHLQYLLLNNNSLNSVVITNNNNNNKNVNNNNNNNNNRERQFAQLSELDISNNPLDCNCTLKSLSLLLNPDQMTCHTTKSPSDTFRIGNLLTGDLTCLSPHTVKVLFLGTLTVVIIAVVAISVVVHLIHFRRNQREELIKMNNESVGNLLMSLRHPNTKIVNDDIVIVSSLAWNDGIGPSDLRLPASEKERQQFQLQTFNGQYVMPVNAGRYQAHQEPLCFIDLNSSTPCQCNYSYPYSNWS